MVVACAGIWAGRAIASVAAGHYLQATYNGIFGVAVAAFAAIAFLRPQGSPR
jgi:hypothetical protein